MKFEKATSYTAQYTRLVFRGVVLNTIFLGFSISGCKDTGSSSEVKITNGTVTTDFPAVVVIDVGKALCSGTFVSKTTLITAAHCIKGRSSWTYNNQQADLAFIPKNYDGSREGDLGVLRWKNPVAPAVAVIGQRRPVIGDKVTLVGYGINDFSNKSGFNIKRVGYNTIAEISGDILLFRGATKDGEIFESSAGYGDSGGALLIDGALVGVISGGSQGEDSVINKHFDLTSDLEENS